MENEITCIEDIISLPDIKSARNLMKKWGLETKGLRNKDEYIQKLAQHWNERGGNCKTQQQDDDPGAGLLDAIAVDHKNRQELKNKYDEIQKFCKDLPKAFQAVLYQAFPDLHKSMEQWKNELDSRECTILVAGETGAGKSAFINLLLEVDILPTGQLSCSQTICEIRKSKNGKKNAYCHYRSNGKKRAPEILDLSNGKGIEELRQRICYVDPDTDDNPYERIEIYMPLPMLEDGIVIVDSPGIGESRQRTRYVVKYLTKSFGSIYIVNMASAGGVNKGRLRDFLRTVVNSGDEDFNPAATIFIGNKIDSVDKRDVEEVKHRTAFKLKQCYPGLKDDNIFFMSVREALNGLQYGTRLPEYKNVLRNGIQRLFPASMRNKLFGHYRFQSQILKRATYTLKVARMKAATGMENKQDEIEDIRRRMDVLERNSRRTIEEMRELIKNEEIKLFRQIADKLRSREFTARVFNIPQDKCAKTRSSKDWKLIARDASEIIGHIISDEIDLWDMKDTVVDQIREKIVKKFQNDCEMYEAQITEIEGALMDGDCRAVTDLHKSMKKQAPVKQLWQKANKGPMGKQEADKVNSIGGVVSGAGGLDTNERRLKDICRSYKAEDKQTKMQELTAIYIESIFAGHELEVKLSKFIGKFLKGIDTIAKKIPEFLSADRQLMNTLRDEISNAATNLRDVFPKYLPQANLLQGELDMFYVKKIMEMDYRLRDLHYNPREHLLGKGSFAEVFKAKVSIGSTEQEVALKIAKDRLRENTVSEVLLENRTMRDLDHPNIVRYFGSTVKEDTGKRKPELYWIMVIEYCNGTLKERVINEDYNNPAKCGKLYSIQVEQMEEMAHIATQICHGLSYLHKKDLVHRDLKLENILIAGSQKKRPNIKLTDVGLTKPQQFITGTSVGTPAYMAPEVLLQTEIYNRKADIYALAIILWEIWYGIDAADHIQQQLFGTLEKAIQGGLRPSMSFEQKPPDDWMALIKQCWQYDPKQRPETENVLQFFTDFLPES